VLQNGIRTEKSNVAWLGKLFTVDSYPLSDIILSSPCLFASQDWIGD
jgi:hypothetical protein